MGRRSMLAWVGLLMFAVAWFVLVHEALGSTSRSARAVPGGSSGGPPGWRAFRASWEILTDGKTWSEIGKDPQPALLGLTGLTNLVMLIAGVAIARGRGPRRGLGWILLLCAALDAGWLYLEKGDFQAGMGVGYYLWTGSFLLVGLAGVSARE